ncbi:unnamed protein product [Candida verbasci]|uniref:Cns1/TTC4 wheel domain-containing protein n=1 Tax=Candida verbasci TaxID=1227364 RepID=A0A9W4XLV9_9ASCO|nr:unnamed protein product [Candida verbasci]
MPPKSEEIIDEEELVNQDKQTDQFISEWDRRRYIPKAGEPELPPQLSELSNKSTDEVIKELNRLPFFMTELDDSDGQGGENTELEALKQLAYDGEPHEIATNFKNQGNDCYKAKQYKHAIEYYNKGLEIDCNVPDINKALLLNRAACNLELRNFRKCIDDCKKVLLIDEKNIKAIFRSAKAFFAIEKYDESIEILKYGLTIDPKNKDLNGILKDIETKLKNIQELKEKREREKQQEALKAKLLDDSIKLRHFKIIKTKSPPEVLQKAKIRLEDPMDYQSQLIFPAMLLYPTIDEFDYIEEISELITPLEILEMILDRPKEWFDSHPGFTVNNLDCFMETETGGLVKVGKKIELNNALMNDKSSKAPLFDNALRLYIVPKQDVSKWISEWSKEKALATRK